MPPSSPARSTPSWCANPISRSPPRSPPPGTRWSNAGGGTSADWPEYGIATLFAAGEDLPLVDPALPAEPLTRPLTVPAGGVRDLPLGRLIGRRRELRAATDQPA